MANDAGPELSDEQFRRLAGYGEIENAEASPVGEGAGAVSSVHTVLAF
jgi:hypothetical protein